MIGVICLRIGFKFLANEDVVASADNRTPFTQASMFVIMLSCLLLSNVRIFGLLLYLSQNAICLYFRERVANALTGLKFICPCIVTIQITANKIQRFLNLSIFTDALHVSGGSSTHHQEHITVHTASGTVNQYCC